MNSLPDFDQLHQLASEAKNPVPVAIAGAAEATVLEAAHIASSRGWIHPILCGPEAEISKIAAENHIDISDMTVIDSETANSAIVAVKEIVEGRAELMMKGLIDTPSLMKAVLDKECGLRTGKTIAQVVLMEIPRDNKRFLMTDTGISLRPSIEQKCELAEHLHEVATALGCQDPKIALMAATEKVNPNMPETAEMAEVISGIAQRHPGSNWKISGPLSFDLAYAAHAGTRKKIDDEVVGNADAMLFSDLSSANLTVKAIMYTAECRFGGVLCGPRVPVVFMSRADDTPTRLNSLSLALRLATARRENQ